MSVSRELKNKHWMVKHIFIKCNSNVAVRTDLIIIFISFNIGIKYDFPFIKLMINILGPYGSVEKRAECGKYMTYKEGQSQVL